MLKMSVTLEDAMINLPIPDIIVFYNRIFKFLFCNVLEK